MTIITADSKLEATKSKYQALLEEGKSELKNLESFEAQRKHDYEVNKAAIF